MNMVSMMGFLMLIGIVVNNGILLVDTINQGNDNYIAYKNEWDEVTNILNRIAESQRDSYKRTARYTNAKNNIELVQSAQYVYKNKYYNIFLIF